MKQVEYFRWRVTAPGRKHPYLTSFHMDAATAEQRYPGATPDRATRRLQDVPETPAELAAAHFHYQSAGRDSVQPPRKRS